MPSFPPFNLAGILVMSMVLSVCTAQSFHFSNGWEPGKRSETVDTCSFRPHIKVLLAKIIENEVQRMVKCGSSGYGDLMTLIQSKRNEMPLAPAVMSERN